jgi:predicted DNA-binding protein
MTRKQPLDPLEHEPLETISLRLPQRLIEKLRIEAQRDRRTPSNIIRGLVYSHLGEK